jgi:hypothetical protein
MVAATYTVHNPHMTPNATQAVIKGVLMTATVDTYEVELVAEDLSNGGIKLRFIGGDIEAAKALFVADAKIKAEFSAAGEAPAAEAPAA